MNVRALGDTGDPVTLPAYGSVLVAADSSDHANAAVREAVGLAAFWDARVTGTHVYAAKMHDVRFRQMEGGLPEQFREEQELERQRDVHDDLITRGLSVITDSYLDQAERTCRDEGVRFSRCPLEGKNYRALTTEANSGRYDLLIMGALGLGAVDGSRLGTVCQRVARRADVDTLVIKEPGRHLADGPLVVAVDGSSHGYGALLTGLALAERWDVPLHVVAAFDPYYHYVAFNRIAGVLSEEAGKVFRFKEQEKLHEEIIDSGLARIYQGHLEVAASIAREHGIDVQTRLLDGKPHDAIEKYLRRVRPTMLLMGRLGIHADPALDIGGNAEALLRAADCAVFLSRREHRPPTEVVADVTTSWSTEAERRMERVPEFVRGMARMAILRFAQERGHTVITERIVEEATAQLMPGHAEKAMAQVVAAREAGELSGSGEPGPEWTDAAQALLNDAVRDDALRVNLRGRAEKKARAERAGQVETRHVEAFLGAQPETAALHWEAPALARLMRVPEGFMREATRERVEAHARGQGAERVTLALAEAGIGAARAAMEAGMQPAAGRCPFGGDAPVAPGEDPSTSPVTWTEDATARLESVPPGFCRDMTRGAAEALAARSGVEHIDEAFVTHIFETFKAGAAQVDESMPWDAEARARIQRAPETVRGMLVREIEGWAQRNGRSRVDGDAVDAVKAQWATRGVFHLAPGDPRGGAGDA